MKINSLSVVITVFLILSGSHFAFGQWELLNPTPTNISLNTVYFINKDIGFIGGDLGLVMKTTDGGKTWKRQYLGTKECVYSIHFINENIGFALSNEFLYILENNSYKTNIYKTVDGGKVWNLLKSWDEHSGYYNYFSKIKVINEDTIFLASHTIIKTTDKGANWTVLDTIQDSSVSDMFFTDDKTGFFCGYNFSKNEYLFGKTNNYGKDWTLTSLHSQSDKYQLNSLFFYNTTTGYAVGDYGVIYKTTDAGLNWNPLNSNTSDNMTSVWFVDSNIGFITCDNGKILKTIDGGLSWKSINTGIVFSLNQIFFIDKDYGIVVGDKGIVLKTTDAFNTIENLSHVQTYNTLYSLSIINSTTTYVCGAKGTVLKTTDEGKNWENLSISTNADLLYNNFSDENNGVVYGRKYNNILNKWDTNAFYITTDGGKKWEQLDFDTNTINSVSFVNAKTAYAAGDKGKFIKTIDGGISWKQLKFDSTNTIRKLKFINNSFGYAFYGDKYVITTNDSGNTWQFKQAINWYSEDKITLESVYFIDSLCGFFSAFTTYGCSHNGYCTETRICKTSDGGNNWKTVIDYHGFVYKYTNSDYPLDDLNIQNIYFTDKNIGYAIGYHPYVGDMILKTTDRGETWNDISYGINSELLSLAFLESGTGYAVGSDGAIFKFKDNDTTKTKDILKVKDKVRVYPNPCNDRLKIDLKHEYENLHIEIYNVNGQKVFKKYIKKPATQITINTSNLCKGMYCLRVFNEDMVLTKKIIVE